MSAMMRGIVALVVLAAIGLAIHATGPTAHYDSCASSEQQVRDMWVAAYRYPEPERTRVAADMIKLAEKVCREQRDAKPTPLPSELQKLAR